MSVSIHPKRVTPAPKGTPRLADVEFSWAWFAALVRPYGYYPWHIEKGTASVHVHCAKENPENTYAPVVASVPITQIKNIAPGALFANLECSMEWFAGMLIANGWGSATPLTVDVRTVSDLYTPSVMVCFYTGTDDHGRPLVPPYEALSASVLPTVPLQRAYADERHTKHKGNPMKRQAVQAGMQFVKNDGLFEVVKPNPKLPGDWFCRSVRCDTGLWSYAPNDILTNLVSNAVVSGTSASTES